MNVLSFARSVSPESRDGDGLGGQTDCCHRAEPMRAGNDRILAVEGEFASAVGGRQSHVFQHFIHTAMQVEIRGWSRDCSVWLGSFGQRFTVASVDCSETRFIVAVLICIILLSSRFGALAAQANTVLVVLSRLRPRCRQLCVCDAGEVSFGKQERLRVRAVEIGAVDRTGEIGNKHATAFQIQGQPNAFHQMS